ncbi:MFS transporter [Ningiella sp. W23]|uniref:MFS transporter n=1 Tax=Ningiella sp. W23 TaxID=3023715 RepID=UPI003756BFE0
MQKSKLLAVLLLTLVNTLSFSILIPVLPFLLRNWQMQDWLFGLLLGVFSLCQFWAAPIFGGLSDQHGRRKILLLTQGGTLLSWLLFLALSLLDSMSNMPVLILLIFLFVVRMVDGITGGNSSVTNAYLSDITTKEQKAKYFGYLSATMGLGMIIGPAIGAYTMASAFGYIATAIFGALLSLVTVCCIYFVLPESLAVKAATAQRDWLQPFKLRTSFAALEGQNVVRNVLIVRIFLAATMAAYTAIMVFYLIDQFELSEVEIGNFLFFVGGFAIFNQVVLIKPIVGFFGEARALTLGLALLCFSLLNFPIIDNYWLLLIVYYFANLGFSICLPTIKSVLTTQTDASSQGKILGLEESLAALMMALMPLISTAIYVLMGVNSFFIWALLAALACVFLVFSCPSILSRQAHLPKSKMEQ